MTFIKTLSEFQGHRFYNTGPRCIDCGTTYSDAVVFGRKCIEKEAPAE